MEACCREVLGKSGVEKNRGKGAEGRREVLGKSGVEQCWERVV